MFIFIIGGPIYDTNNYIIPVVAGTVGIVLVILIIVTICIVLIVNKRKMSKRLHRCSGKYY